ncbi:NAD(P)-dependent oxidoreductase [Brachybacterium sp. EF45031]|uniref:NAD-dependent epimerase/dehydratase family protein n=1 Tax=Brachybacterium sillae TaxID=2810536 RepID=UPI00217CD377|nr:NAD(P)-dependent oxidoreductase [Brachybacterium sillae]MCS6710956.1 NAD(P)-dependent oxidoreductase [Brachybacterium sillae]
MTTHEKPAPASQDGTPAHPRRRILITGATGAVGLGLVERLGDEYEILEHGRTPRTSRQETSLLRADLGSVDEVQALLDGVDTIVHLAGAASPESDWEAVLEANIIGTRTVLEAARRAGTRRVVLASSNHAMGMYDRHEQWPVYPHQVPRPDSLYGVSKVFGETLGRFYHDEHGLDVICLRIGWVDDDPLKADEDVLRAMWLSPDDAARVVRRAIEAEVRFGLYYAISDNPNRRWDLTNTMLELGYRPQDSWTDLPGATETVVEGGAPVRDSWPKGS